MKVQVKKLKDGQIEIHLPLPDSELSFILTKAQAKSLGDVLSAATK